MKFSRKQLSRQGSALVTVLFIACISIVIMASTLNRTYTVAKLNDRNNDVILCQNAAEAAVEGVFSRMQRDFQQTGPGLVKINADSYKQYYPGNASVETPRATFFDRFIFSDTAQDNRTYVKQLTNYTGALPQAYPGRATANAPLYRIVSNARLRNGSSSAIGTAQLDVLLALVPLTTYSIFYNDNLEFSTCANMTNTGPVHCNKNITVGTSAALVFNSTVTSVGTITAPGYTNPTNSSDTGKDWHTWFKGTPDKITGVPTVALSINMTNTYGLLQQPSSPDADTDFGKQRLFNQAQVVMLVSNTTVTAIIQKAPDSTLTPGNDVAPVIMRTNYSSTNYTYVQKMFPFLDLKPSFYDRREDKTNSTAQIDVGLYGKWIATNSSVLGKYPASGADGYPTILYVANNVSEDPNHLSVVRLTNGIAPPVNGTLGFAVATPNPLYVWGDYNQTNSSYLQTTNTSKGTVPCALLSDALTILSSNWKDADSTKTYTSRQAVNTTVNAAILTGVVTSTGTYKTTSDFQNGTWSGGVHNLPRLLEDWNSPSTKGLTLNTSIINLFSSHRATNQFIYPGTYYDPPNRKFSFDLNFSDPSKTPPGIPCALVALRFNWSTPAPSVH